MKKYVTLALALMLLSPMASLARHHQSPSPSPSPSDSPSPQATDKQSFQMTASLLSSFETKNSDGDPSRDDIVLVEELTRSGPGSVALSYHSFYLKDPRGGRYYEADTTNNNDFNNEEPARVSTGDGTLDTFKVYFTVPGTLRPTKLYVKVGDTMEVYPLHI